MELTEIVNKRISEIKGLGKVSAEKLFVEKEADTEELQMLVLDEYEAEIGAKGKIKIKRKGVEIEIDKKELKAFLAVGFEEV